MSLNIINKNVLNWIELLFIDEINFIIYVNFIARLDVTIFTKTFAFILNVVNYKM